MRHNILFLDVDGVLNHKSWRENNDDYFDKPICAENMEHLKGIVDIYLAETDTCPHNRYSTSAAMLHGHFTASILEGATGAKHWITRNTATEVNSGKAFRKTLIKYE